MIPGEVIAGLDRWFDQVLAEDLQHGDLTTRLLFDAPVPARARLVARQPLVAAGVALVERVFHRIDPAISVNARVRDGERAASGDTLAELRGDGRVLLAGERTALNLLQHLCGIATLTARFVEAVAGLPVRILDTRKTTPGLRTLEKYAVRMGGGNNHRMSLGDGILIKDNHLALLGNGPDRLRRLQQSRITLTPHQSVQMEANTMSEVDEALAAGADAILLDNMTPDQLRRCVTHIAGRAITEASGGVTLENIKEVAGSGVDLISIGALTHSAPTADISLEIEPA